MVVDKEARNKSIEFHNQAVQVVGSDKMQAYRLLCSAVTVDPSMAVGWYAMGNALADLKMIPASIAAFRRCLACPEGDLAGDLDAELKAKALVNLGHRLANAGSAEESEVVTAEAIRFLEANPELDREGRAFAWTNMSLALSVQGRVGESLEFAKAAFEKSQEPIIETGLAFAYLFAGDYALGLKHFEARFPYRLPAYLSYPYPRWDGERLSGTLFVAADQGIGDTLSMARFVPWAAGRVERVVFQVQPELLRLMAGAFAAWKNVVIEPQSTIFPIADAWCPVMSLPVAMGMTTDQIRDQPQIWVVPRAEMPIANGWKAKGARLHVGIAYAGSPLNEIDQWRSVEVTRFLELCRVTGVQVYSLQVGERTADLHAAGMAALVRDMSPWLRDALDTAAVMRELDLVVSIESFVAHLAGALGKECWVLLSRRGGDWRCGRSGDRPLWYEKTRLFRQGEDGEWGPVFSRVVEALRERVDGPN